MLRLVWQTAHEIQRAARRPDPAHAPAAPVPRSPAPARPISPTRPGGAGNASPAIRAALARLAPEERHLLELVYFDGLTSNQVATRLGLPRASVLAQLQAGLRQLQRALAQPADGAPVTGPALPVAAAVWIAGAGAPAAGD